MPKPPTSKSSVSGLVGATRAELVRLGRLDSMLGQQVLVIAHGMAAGEGSELATLSREHSRLMGLLGSSNPAGAGVDPVGAAVSSIEEKRARARVASSA